MPYLILGMNALTSNVLLDAPHYNLLWTVVNTEYARFVKPCNLHVT